MDCDLGSLDAIAQNWLAGFPRLLGMRYTKAVVLRLLAAGSHRSPSWSRKSYANVIVGIPSARAQP